MNFEKIREDIAESGTNIFLDSAGSSLMPRPVVERIKRYLKEEQEIGGYQTAENHLVELGTFYVEASRLINAQPHNIAFTHDATDSYIKALSCIDFREGDVIVTTEDDYGSNQIQFISLQQRFGIQIRRTKTLDNGDLNLAHFQELVDQYAPKLVAATHVPTNSGLVQNVKAIGEICHEHKILFLLDACQSIGQLDVDVNEIKCDFLSATGRKFLRGPRGTGFLYVSDSVLDSGVHPLFIDGHGGRWRLGDEIEILQSAKRFETWEKPYAFKVGLIEALKYLNSLGIRNVQEHNSGLMQHFRKNLLAMPKVNLYDKGAAKCNILTFNKESKSLDDITSALKVHSVIFSVSHKYWQIIDFKKKGLEWAIRLSPHYFNTTEEIDKVCDFIEGI